MESKRAIHVKTKVDFLRLILELHDHDYVWRSGAALTERIDHIWHEREDNTVIYIYYKESEITRGSVSSHIDFGKGDVELEQYTTGILSKTKEDNSDTSNFKIGDKVYVDLPRYFEEGKIYTIESFDDWGMVNFEEDTFVALPFRLTPAVVNIDSRGLGGWEDVEVSINLDVSEITLNPNKKITLCATRVTWDLDKKEVKIAGTSPRSKIIREAKEYVEHVTDNYWSWNIRFVINAEKRTVVALRETPWNDQVIRGIAKCSPDEVFNEDIGKAIALGRLLRKDVPEKFLNAPQPSQPEVGMKVRITYGNSRISTATLTKRRESDDNRFGRGKAFSINDSDSWLVESDFTILEDSDVDYEGGHNE